MNLNSYFHPEYNPNLGVYQAVIPHSYEPGRVKGTGFWGNVYLPNNPEGLKVGTEYTMTTSINGKLVGVPMFNPYNSDPTYLDAMNWYMRYQDDQSKGGKNVPFDEDKMKVFDEARRNSFLWGNHRISQGISPNFVYGVDKIDTSRPQFYGNNQDKSWTYSNGTTKLFKENGELIPEEEALKIYKSKQENIKKLRDDERVTEANELYSQLRNNILYNGRFAVENNFYEDEENQNKERHKNYVYKSKEDVEKEFDSQWEDSHKETAELLKKEQEQKEYRDFIENSSNDVESNLTLKNPEKDD